MCDHCFAMELMTLCAAECWQSFNVQLKNVTGDVAWLVMTWPRSEEIPSAGRILSFATSRRGRPGRLYHLPQSVTLAYVMSRASAICHHATGQRLLTTVSACLPSNNNGPLTGLNSSHSIARPATERLTQRRLVTHPASTTRNVGRLSVRPDSINQGAVPVSQSVVNSINE